MAKQEKGAPDSFMSILKRDMMMKGAIELSRDKNGKIDVNKANGISLGYGYTSAGDIARMGAMLGAEGAFDDNRRGGGGYHGVPASAGSGSYNRPDPPASVTIGATEYTEKKRGIRAENIFIIATCAVALCFLTFVYVFMMITSPDEAVVYIYMTALAHTSFVFAVFWVTRSGKQQLSDLEDEYRRSEQIKAQQKNAKADADADAGSKDPD